ncbi:DivIVA domain-containing protein [Aureibacter tunicatorum]|uniref:Cell division initiation protein n=1 Tax=Aureibacter tunicatorum TaxID=866807 RepID=A0AAE4BSA9_9BACT|nr:DivIVA domain-containing protein [Aureibacter tunicatorum]MDR6241044.1 cell division initiation protein [Aureibacter tunicatorum]BDD03822.1 hypothetical protein AUTU_13050 [Aureibacter tunicatorum]
MKVTPLEIRQKSFERVFRGYDKEEVEAYLQSLSQEWERLLDKNKELNMKLENAQKELEKLHEVESSLFKTLKTAEDTSQNILNQANQKAALKIKEATMEAEKTVRDANTDAEKTIRDANTDAEETNNKAQKEAEEIVSNAEKHAKQIMDHMLEQIKEMEYHFRELEDTKVNLTRDLTRIATQINSKVADADNSGKGYRSKIDELVQKAKMTHRFASDLKKMEELVDGDLTGLEAEELETLNEEVVQKEVKESTSAQIEEEELKEAPQYVHSDFAEEKKEYAEMPMEVKSPENESIEFEKKKKGSFFDDLD